MGQALSFVLSYNYSLKPKYNSLSYTVFFQHLFYQ